MNKYKIIKEHKSIYPYYIDLYKVTDAPKRRRWYKISCLASLLLLTIPSMTIKAFGVFIGVSILVIWTLDSINSEDYNYLKSFDTDEALHQYVAELEITKDKSDEKEVFYL